MKAKQYAAKYNGNNLGEIAFEFTKEIGELVTIRQVKTDSGIVSILNELNQKWKAFCRLIDSKAREDGFQIAVKEIMPEVYEFWHKEGIR